ncbi:MAG TPA: hypothetical protein VGL46_13715 [Pseudonocardiaceae bacterium]
MVDEAGEGGRAARKSVWSAAGVGRGIAHALLVSLLPVGELVAARPGEGDSCDAPVAGVRCPRSAPGLAEDLNLPASVTAARSIPWLGRMAWASSMFSSSTERTTPWAWKAALASPPCLAETRSRWGSSAESSRLTNMLVTG